MKQDYEAPRWSGELIDCSMPMTFDTYSVCSFNCLYCFSYFQKSHACGKNSYLDKTVSCVNIERTKNLFNGALSGNYDIIKNDQKSFIPYIRGTYIMQWGGLADGFDDFEKKYGVSLELLRFFDEMNYPLSISTKGTWWTKDERYMSLLRQHKHNWHFKISIITSNPLKAAGVERGVDSPELRFEAIRRIAETGCPVTLRLRPYLIGVSDDWRETISRAAKAGVNSVTTEFFCLEARADPKLRAKYEELSKFCGYDIWGFYRDQSKGAGYRRLNYTLKAPIITQMKAYSESLGLRFYVSDAHHKAKSDFCCCCGVPPSWNVSKGHFAEALQIAKSRPDGLVYWKDIEPDCRYLLGDVQIVYPRPPGFNSQGNVNRASRLRQTLGQFIQDKWNSPKEGNSPYTYFDGVLYPVGLDKDNNVIYKYNKKKEETV